jgi:hypothetical protein
MADVTLMSGISGDREGSLAGPQATPRSGGAWGPVHGGGAVVRWTGTGEPQWLKQGKHNGDLIGNERRW